MARTRRFDPARLRRRARSALPTTASRRVRAVVGSGLAVALALLCLLVLAAPAMAGASGASGVSGASDGAVPDRSSLNPSGDDMVRDTTDATGSFGDVEYVTPAGDLVEIDVSVDGSDPTYVVVGGDRLSDGGPTGFLDVLRVTGDATITVNTRLLGTNASTDAVYATDGASVSSYAHGAEHGPETPVEDLDGFDDLTLVDGASGATHENLSAFRSAVDVGSNPAPLAPQRYRLLLGSGNVTAHDGTVQLEHRLDRADLRLTPPAFRERVDVYTALADDVDGAESVDDLLGPARERDAITRGDRLILGFEATGIWGALAWATDGNPDDRIGSGGNLSTAALDDLFTSDHGDIRGEGVSLTIRQTNAGMNEPTTELDLSAVTGDTDAVQAVYGPPEDLTGHGDGPTPSAFYLVFDTGAGAAFDGTLDPGDEYAVTFGLDGVEGDRYRFDRPGGGPAEPFAAASATDSAVDEQFPYRALDEGDVSATASFSIRDPDLSFDDVTDDGVVLVENGTTVTLSGETTLHPETELTAEFVADAGENPTVETRSVDISENDTFSIRAVLSDVPVGSPVSLELYEGTSLYDTRSLVVVEDANDPAQLAIDDAPDNLTVIQGDSLERLSVDVRNDGYVDGVDRLSLDVADGALTDDRRIRVKPDRTTTVAFSRVTADLEPGEYAYSIGIGDDETNGTLVVAPGSDWEPDEEADGEGDAMEGSEGDAPNGETEDGTDSEDVDNGETGTDGEADANDPTAADDGGDASTDADGDDDTTDAGDGSNADGDGGDADDDGGDADGDGSDADDDGIDADDDGSDPEEGGGDNEPSEPRTAIPLPFGIGTREAVSGTLLVGAMYVAGHWV